MRSVYGAVALSILVLMVATKDLGTPLVIVMTLGAMWFLSGAKLRHVFGVIAAGVGGVVALIFVAPHRMRYVSVGSIPFCERAAGDALRACLDASAAAGELHGDRRRWSDRAPPRGGQGPDAPA